MLLSAYSHTTANLRLARTKVAGGCQAELKSSVLPLSVIIDMKALNLFMAELRVSAVTPAVLGPHCSGFIASADTPNLGR